MNTIAKSTKKPFYILVILGLVALGVVIYFSINPEDSKFFPKCAFHSLTGYDCPGCGSQRVIHSLLNLQFKQAFFYNPLLVLSIPYILFGLYMEYMGGKQKYPNLRRRLYGQTAIVVVFVVVILFWIGRNISW